MPLPFTPAPIISVNLFGLDALSSTTEQKGDIFESNFRDINGVIIATSTSTLKGGDFDTDYFILHPKEKSKKILIATSHSELRIDEITTTFTKDRNVVGTAQTNILGTDYKTVYKNMEGKIVDRSESEKLGEDTKTTYHTEPPTYTQAPNKSTLFAPNNLNKPVRQEDAKCCSII